MLGGLLQACVEVAAHAVDGRLRDGIQPGEVVEVGESGVDESVAGTGFLPGGVLGFEGESGAAHDVGKAQTLEDESEDDDGGGEGQDQRAPGQWGAVGGGERDGQGCGQRHHAPGAGPGHHARQAPGRAAAGGPDRRGQREHPHHPQGDQSGGDGECLQRPQTGSGREFTDQGRQFKADDAEDDALEQEDHHRVHGVQLQPDMGVTELVPGPA